MSGCPKPLPRKQFLPERLGDEEIVEVNISWNRKVTTTPAKLHQREDGMWALKFSIGINQSGNHENSS